MVAGYREGLRPVERLTPSKWADRYRYLSSVASAEPGLWRTSRVPFIKEILDRFSYYDDYQQIIVMKGSQLAFTEAGMNVIGYTIDVDPGPVMLVMPTIETMRRNSKIRVDPMINESPTLKEKVGKQVSRASGNTLLQKDFKGGVLVMSGANSAASLRSLPIRTLILDEVDGYPDDLDGEGSPVDLAIARTRTFSRKKIFMLSSPTIHGASKIEAEYEQTTKRQYFVPCPECAAMQTLMWEQLKWEKGKPDTARYHCLHCGHAIEERYKPFMLANGEWRDTEPDNASDVKIGYHINSLYSAFGWYSWRQAAEEWEEANKSSTNDKLKVFVNTVLGETWREPGEVPDWENLLNRKGGFKQNIPPANVAFITVGVDVQKDRLELEVVGWAKGKHSYSIDYRVLVGDTSNEDVWDDLAVIVNEKWEREDGTILGMSKMAIDTGYNTQQVYAFCRRFHPSQVIPVKGQDKQAVVLSTPTAVDKGRKGKIVGSLRLYNIGVSILKSELYGWLRLGRKEDGSFPDGYCFFNPGLDDQYFKMLTAEVLQKNIVKGFARYEWVKMRPRNEALDCRVYARAAAATLGMDRWRDPDWEAMLRSHVTSKPKARKAPSNPDAPASPAKKKRRSSFWNQ